MREKIRKWVPPVITVAITIFIFYMSSRPAGQSDEISLETTKTAVEIWSLLPFLNWAPEVMQEFAYMLNPFMRKVAHFAEFAALGMGAMGTVLSVKKLRNMWIRMGCAGGYCLLVAVLDETLQLFIEGRHGSVWDVLLDSSGAIVGIFVLVLFVQIQKRKKYPNRTKAFCSL